MAGDAGEIGDDDVARNFFVAAFAGEVLNVTEGLGFSLAEVFAAAFVFDENDAGPKEVNPFVVPERLLTGSSKLATARRETPKTSKN